MSVGRLKDRKGWYFSCRINGKQYKKEKYNNKKMATKAEAMAAEQDFIIKMGNGNNENITLYLLFAEFMESKSTLKPNTIRNYQTFERIELHYIQDKKLSALAPKDIQQWKNKLIEQETSIAYKNRKMAVMRQVLEYGSIIYGINPNLQKCLIERLKDYGIKDIASKEKWLKMEDFERLISHLDTNKENDYYYYVIFNVLYYTGLRIGELAALTPNDLHENYITINKAFVKIGANEIVSSPKTENSIRNVYINAKIYQLFSTYLSLYYKNGVIFHKSSNYINEQKVRRMLHKLAKIESLDITHEIKIHNLRHSHACNLSASGWTEYEIAARLGNTPKISSSTYIHPDSAEIIEKSLKL